MRSVHGVIAVAAGTHTRCQELQCCDRARCGRRHRQLDVDSAVLSARACAQLYARIRQLCLGHAGGDQRVEQLCAQLCALCGANCARRGELERPIEVAAQSVAVADAAAVERCLAAGEILCKRTRAAVTCASSIVSMPVSEHVRRLPAALASSHNDARQQSIRSKQ